MPNRITTNSTRTNDDDDLAETPRCPVCRQPYTVDRNGPDRRLVAHHDPTCPHYEKRTRMTTNEALRQTLLGLNDIIGRRRPVELEDPTLPREDDDGSPLGVGVTGLPVDLASVTITAGELAAAGLSRDDVPHIRVVSET